MTVNSSPEPAKTILTITVGFLAVYLIFGANWALYTAFFIGLAGVLSDWLARKITFLWMKLAWILSFFMPNILLSVVFFLLLLPLAILSRIFGPKDPLMLKNNYDTLFRKRSKPFEKADFEKLW